MKKYIMKKSDLKNYIEKEIREIAVAYYVEKSVTEDTYNNTLNCIKNVYNSNCNDNKMWDRVCLKLSKEVNKLRKYI